MRQPVLHSKVVGIKDLAAADIGLFKGTQNASVPNTTKHANPPLFNAELLNKLNITNVTKKSSDSKEPLEKGIDKGLLETAARNMQDLAALYMRRNTGNKVYGYSPETKKGCNMSFDAAMCNDSPGKVIRDPGPHKFKQDSKLLANAGKCQITLRSPEASPQKGSCNVSFNSPLYSGRRVDDLGNEHRRAQH